VLAPLLMMGGALGSLETAFLPDQGPGFWPLVSMSAILGGTMRSPFTGIVFGLELTHDVNTLLPLLIAVVIAHAFTVLILPRSILTEKVSRRGYHLTRDYATDPLEMLFVREAMRTDVLAFPAASPLTEIAQLVRNSTGRRRQRLYPVVGPDRELVGIVTRSGLQQALAEPPADEWNPAIESIANLKPVVAYPDETLRTVVYRMAETGLTRLPVVERGEKRRLVGLVGLPDLLKARTRNLDEERRRERVLQMRIPIRLRRFDGAVKSEAVASVGNGKHSDEQDALTQRRS